MRFIEFYTVIRLFAYDLIYYFGHYMKISYFARNIVDKRLQSCYNIVTAREQSSER